MSEKMNAGTPKEENLDAKQYGGGTPATEGQINLAEEFVRRVGADPKEVNYSVQITAKEVSGEDGESTVIYNPRTGWVKSRKLATDFDSDIDIESLLVRKAKPVRITPTRRVKPKREDELTLCMGDAQIGWRGEESFHDPRAMSLALAAIREIMPDRIALTGDMIDLPSMSRYEQRGDWHGNTQRSIDTYFEFLSQMRANAPNARISVAHGNHERRMEGYVRNNAAEVLGLRRAKMERELAVMTLEYLCRYDDLDIESADGYPNAAIMLENNLQVTHGTNVAKGGSNAAKYLREEGISTIFGHTHRLEVAYRTIPLGVSGKGNRLMAASPGCLAKIDGHVPGYRYSVSSQGTTVPRAEDWQQGLLLVNHNERFHDATPLLMHEDGINLYGKRIQLSNEDTEDNLALRETIKIA